MKKNILHKQLSAYKYPETPYAINAIPKMMKITSVSVSVGKQARSIPNNKVKTGLIKINTNFLMSILSPH